MGFLEEVCLSRDCRQGRRRAGEGKEPGASWVGERRLREASKWN